LFAVDFLIKSFVTFDGILSYFLFLLVLNYVNIVSKYVNIVFLSKSAFVSKMHFFGRKMLFIGY